MPQTLFSMDSIPQIIENTTVTDTRSLLFYNVNTLDYLDVTYFQNGLYLDSALTSINDIMIDRRSNQTTKMDVSLIDTLHQIYTLSGSSEPMDIICGYRSPKTNAKMSRAHNGVAKHSFHTLGQAADINIKDVPLSRLREIALSLNAGGVGIYPRSGFVHVDVGPVRQWIG